MASPSSTKFFSLLLFIIATLRCVQSQDEWLYGRATFYGNEWWLWNIHEGSCGFGYLCPEEGTGWDIAALPDVHWAYSNSCGRCYEIACHPMVFQDNYNETLDRSYQCYSPESSLVVTVTDTCPCYYQTNFYSNQRWCCGDMDHLDISIWAFEKLAEARYGVIGLKYREVPCDHKPAIPAPELADPFPATPIPEGTVCPRNQFPLKDNWEQIQAEHRIKAAVEGAGMYANPPALDISESAAFKMANQMYEDRVSKYLVEESAMLYEDTEYEEYAANVNNDEYQDVEQGQGNEQYIFSNGVQSGWQSISFRGEHSTVQGAGAHGGDALCAMIAPGGMLMIRGQQGFVSQSSFLDLQLKQNNQDSLELDVSLAGSSGVSCAPIAMSQLPNNYEDDGFNHFQADLNQLGCSETDTTQLDSVVFANNQDYEQDICMDKIKVHN